MVSGLRPAPAGADWLNRKLPLALTHAFVYACACYRTAISRYAKRGHSTAKNSETHARSDRTEEQRAEWFIVAILTHPDAPYPPQTDACVLHSEDYGPLLNVLQERLSA